MLNNKTGNHARTKPRGRNERTSWRWLLWPALLASALLVLLLSSIPLTLDQQLLFVLASLGLSLLLRPRNELARYRVIVLISISVIATGRYIYWRLTQSLGWFNSNLDLTLLDYVFSLALLVAEIYAWVVLFLGYFQTIWPLRRPVYPLPADRSLWPSVDVLIPTYNEPLKVVIPSVLAAAKLDWPADRLNVYLLDDGCREEFRSFAKEAGVHYIERESSEGAKAGNINHALQYTDGDYIAIFDCDHVPVRSFLRRTMGWFLRDDKLGIVQTPHFFFTPDPVERNLQVYHRVPPEGQLFYGLVQDGNDTWNASFFCGSCAVLKREALNEIGGIATDTVTEDAHTSLLIQKKGWNTAYLNEPLAAGLATERLSQHIGQRTRWARGMVQIFRKDNPLVARGLSLGQRLCYFNAMLHFLFGLPRLIFLTAPLAYLFFEAYVIQASAAMIAVYALPHVFQAQVANSVMQGRYRHSFWADVYETLISAHLIGPTLGPLINPSGGRFNVTDKGGVVREDHFDWRSARVVFLLLILNLTGLLVAFIRLFWLNPDESGTVLINLGWTVYNSIILGTALSVAWEKRQRRDTPRIHREFRARVHLPDGHSVDAMSRDISLTDTSLHVPGSAPVERDEPVIVELFDGDKGYSFPGLAKTVAGEHLGVLFGNLSPAQLSDLVYFTHARDDSWERWYHVWSPRKPLASFFEIVRFGVLGVFRALGGHSDDPENRVRPGFSTALWLMVIFLLVLSSYLVPQIAGAQERPVLVDVTTRHLAFSDLGLDRPIRLRGGNSQDSVWFALRADRVAKQASLKLHVDIARQLLKDYRALDISLNGQPLGNIPLTADTVEQDIVQTFPIDPLYISDINQLSFKLQPVSQENCEKLGRREVTARIHKDSMLTIVTHPLDLANDLSDFPLPFYDKNDDAPLNLPFIFSQALSQSPAALKAAGILASWFGGKADYRSLDFPVLIDQAPERHAVVLATPATHYDFLPSLTIQGPGVEMRSLPDKDKSHIKLLVIKGRNNSELIAAATTLVSGQTPLAGDHVDFNHTVMPGKRQPYDAPRWLNDGGKTYFSELAPPQGFSQYGISPDRIDIHFRVAPDLFNWRANDLPVTVNYSYSDLPLKAESSLDVLVSGQWIKSLHVATNDTLPQPLETPDGPRYKIPRIEDSSALYLKKDGLAGLNTLTLYYDIQLPDDAARTCASLYTDNMTTGIDPDSHFDLTGWTHYARMPDNAKFANIGYPFTRMADLSESAVILPESPTANEIRTMLDVLGKLGAASGYPAFRLLVTFPRQAVDATDRDIIMIGGDERQSLLDDWRDAMPIVRNANGQWSVRRLSWQDKAALWWKGEKSERFASASEILSDIGPNLAAVSSFESPIGDNRTVVLLAANHQSDYPLITAALNDDDSLRNFTGDLTLFQTNRVDSFRIAPSYYVGYLPWLTWTRWYLSNHIMALLLLFTAVVLIMSLIMKTMLRHQAENRFNYDLRPS